MTVDLDKTHDTPVKCVHCNHIMSNSSGHEEAPTPGDFTLCIQCAGLNVFDKKLALRKPTKREARSATNDDEVQDIHAAILRAHAAAKHVN